ncbi:MAG: hypothetical protein AB8E82_00290 [Aureispira sp.]
MKTSAIYFVALLLSVLMACQNNSKPAPSPANTTADSLAVPTPTPIVEKRVAGAPVILIVRTAEAHVYERPDFDAPILSNYQQGDSLTFTNRITQQHSSRQLEGFTYKEPWLRVILPNQQMAWVYGPTVNFDAQLQPALAELVLYPRVAALFGPSLAQQIGLYQKEQAINHSMPGFRTLYSRAQNIKDSLELYLDHFMNTNPATASTDFFWLNELLDGLLLHYIPEQKKYYLFRDLKVWQRLSQQTPAPEDDAFVEVLLAAYPSDSISYYYYGWQLPLEENNFCSLLGSDIHAQVLAQLNKALDSNSYFLPELQQIQQAVLNDITTTNQYWMPLPAVQQELQTILAQNYPFLDRGNLIALKTKQSFLEAPDKHDLVLNLFEGEE